MTKKKKMALGGELENISNLADPIDPVKPSRIPLPDYKNPESRLQYARAFREKYGKDTLKGYGDIPLRVNEKPAWASDTSKGMAIKAASSLGLDPALFYASSMIEGQSGLFPGADKRMAANEVRSSGDKDYPVSGLWSFGLDSFTDYYPTLKKKGYLPKDFDKNFKIWEAEGGPTGTEDVDPESVMFKNTDAGVQAKAAMMKAYYDELDSYAKSKKINLNPDQRNFFALAHFNSGNHGYQMLDAYSKAGLLKNNDFINKMPNLQIPGVSSKLHQQIYGNVAPRLAAARGLKEEGLFEYGGKMPKKPKGVPKYELGTEDPILGDPITGGTNNWMNTNNGSVPINPNAPANQQIFRLDNTGNPVKQGNGIVPLSQFYDTAVDALGNRVPQGTGRYVDEQGNPNQLSDQQAQFDQLSAYNRQNANQWKDNRDDAEMLSSLGMTAINAYFNKRNAQQEKRSSRRNTLMQQINTPTFNPYAEGTGSQAIMEDGGVIDPIKPIITNNPKDPRLVAYQDSASAYNQFYQNRQNAIKAFNTLSEKGLLAAKNKDVQQSYGAGDWSQTQFNLFETQLSNFPNSNVKPSIVYGKGERPLLASREFGTGFTPLDFLIGTDNFGLYGAAEYKKPVQPVIYQPAKPVKKEYGGKLKYKNGGEISGDDLGIQTLGGGKSEMISSSNHSNPMVEFKGRTHDEGGIDLQYGGNIAEVEDKEVGFVGQDGGLNIFGKLKLPGTNQTFRKTAKDIADQENKVDGLKSKYLNILNNSNQADPYQQSAQSTAKVMFKSLDKQSKQIAEKKEALASYQNLILSMADQGSKMAYGGTIPKKPKFADGGVLDDTDPITGIRKAIAQFESGADYNAIGKPVTSGQYKGQRAIGKYQIMEDNVRAWGKEATGKNITIAEFIADPKLQDQVAEYQMRQIAKKHPNPKDIASIWFTGRPTSDKSAGSAKDVNGTTGNQYVNAVMRIYGGIDGSSGTSSTNTGNLQSALSSDALSYTPVYEPLGGSKDTPINTKYGAAKREPTPFSDKANIGNGSRERGFISPLALEQIAPELLTIATNRRENVPQLSYNPDLKQTFDLSYQLGRNENQSSFNQVAKIAEQTGNVDALSQLAAQKYKADEAYNMQEIQGNAAQKLQTYNQNVDVLNDSQMKNLAFTADQQIKQAQAKFNTRAEDLSAFKSIAGKVQQNKLENTTYNAYANLFQHYGFDKKGNVSFEPDKITQRFTPGQAQQFGMMAAQQGAQAIMNGDFSRQFTKVKNPDGSQTTTETLGTNKKIQEEYKALKSQGFDDNMIGNMLQAKYPTTISD